MFEHTFLALACLFVPALLPVLTGAVIATVCLKGLDKGIVQVNTWIVRK